MATANTKFTQAQIDNLSGVAKKYGGFDNANFQTAVNTKYGAGSYESLKSNLSAINEAQKAKATAPVISAQVTPIGMQTTEGAPVQPVTPHQQPQPQAETNLNAPISSVPAPKAITPPPTVEKTTTITPDGQTVVKKETPGEIKPDYNVGKGREQEILTNLNDGYSQDPNIQKAVSTGDYNTFKQAYGYDTADQTKKTMLDAFFQARQPKNSESFFQTLTQGMKIENSKYRESPEARNAQHRFDLVGPYKGASADNLYNGMLSGTITPGSQGYKDLLQLNGGIETPEMIQAKQKLETKRKVDTINDNLRQRSSDANGTTPTEKPDVTQSVSDTIISKKGFDYATRFKEVVNDNPEVKTLAEDIKKDSLRKKEIERIRSDIFKNIVKNNPGMTMGAANLKAKYESEGYDDEYNNLIDTLNVNSADLRYKTSMLEKEFDYEFKQAEKEDDRAYEAQKDSREFGQQKELAQYQQELGLKGDQAKFEQQMAQKAQIASDPVLATQDVLDTYAKLGILPERSNAEIIQSVQNDIASGMTLGESLTNLNKAFQSKPQYKDMLAPKEKAQPQVWTKLNDTTLFNQATGEQKSVSSLTKGASATDLLSVPDGTVIPSRLSETTNPNKGKECAEYINDIAGLGMGDTYASKVAKTNTQVHEEASVGNIAVWNPNPSDPKWNKYGHAGVIVGEEGDNWLIRSSNLKGDGAVTTDKIPKKSIYSYNTEKKIQIPQAQAGGTQGIAALGQFMKDNQDRGTGYSKDDVEAFNEKIDRYVKTGDENGMTLAYRNMIMKDKDFKKDFDDTKKFVTALDQVQNLVNDYEKAGKSTNAAKAFAEKIARSLGMTTDQALAQLQTQMGFTLANYIKSISGTAASDAEVQRLMGNMAQIGNVKDLNTTILKQVKDNGLNGLKSMIDTRMYGMPEELKPKIFGDIYTQGKKYKTDQGEFTEEEIDNEVRQAIQSGESIENIKKWLKSNNIPFTE